jgi:hypothetical protein
MLVKVDGVQKVVVTHTAGTTDGVAEIVVRGDVDPGVLAKAATNTKYKATVRK